MARSRDRTAPIQGLARNAEEAHDIAIVEPSKTSTSKTSCRARSFLHSLRRLFQREWSDNILNSLPG